MNADLIRAVIVDVIRGLWDRGLYRKNRWLHRVHDQWLGYWLDWKTAITMEEVDLQAEEINQPVPVWEAVFFEDLDGETPLGGEMRLSTIQKRLEGRSKPPEG